MRCGLGTMQRMTGGAAPQGTIAATDGPLLSDDLPPMRIHGVDMQCTWDSLCRGSFPLAGLHQDGIGPNMQQANHCMHHVACAQTQQLLLVADQCQHEITCRALFQAGSWAHRITPKEKMSHACVQLRPCIISGDCSPQTCQHAVPAKSKHLPEGNSVGSHHPGPAAYTEVR